MPGEAPINAAGLAFEARCRAAARDRQSIAFLRTPGTPWLYSGVAISSASRCGPPGAAPRQPPHFRVLDVLIVERHRADVVDLDAQRRRRDLLRVRSSARLNDPWRRLPAMPVTRNGATVAMAGFCHEGIHWRMTFAELRRFLDDRPSASRCRDRRRNGASRLIRDGSAGNPKRASAARAHAAALLLLYPGEGGPMIPLTVRRSDLPHHPARSASRAAASARMKAPARAALREAHEDDRRRRRSVQVMRRAFDDLGRGQHNHLVWPFVGVVDERPRFRVARGG
jgi:hypothetical protein